MLRALSAVILALAFAAPAQAAYPSYVSITTFTPVATGSMVYAFQNKSSANDAVIRKVEVLSCTTGAVSGGFMQFWGQTASAIAAHGSTRQTSSYALGSGAEDAAINVSTGPVGVTIENDGGTDQGPLFTCVINNDEGATSYFRDTCYDANDPQLESLVLAKGANRGLVLTKMQLARSDYTDGCAMVRVTYYLKP